MAEKPKKPQSRGPDSMLYWLARAAREARLAAGTKTKTVLVPSPWDGQQSVDRFEAAKHWPEDPDWVVAAYVATTGLRDSRELWRNAVDLWMIEGGVNPRRVEEALGGVAQATAKARGKSAPTRAAGKTRGAKR